MDLKQILLGSLVLGFLGVVVSEESSLAQQPLKQFQTTQALAPQTAQKRFDLWKKEKKNGGGGGGGGGGWGSEVPPSMPGGFGMYPLWKFHKFDGFSLRPVPIQLDIGHGIPALPQSNLPAYQSASGWGSGAQQSSYGGGQQSSSGGYAPAGGYGQQQSSGYGQQSGGGYQSSGGYNNQAPITMAYQAAPQPSYTPSYPQPAYGGNSQPNYGPPPPAQPSYSAPQTQSYSAPQTQSYSAPEMSYGASNAQPVATVPGGNSFGAQGPSYAAAAFEGNSPYGGVSDLSMPSMDTNNQGGYMKRYYNRDSDSSQQPTSSVGENENDAQ